ncbi:MAG: sensor histidine kinase [Leptolyngbya sp. BL-A-14]
MEELELLRAQVSALEQQQAEAFAQIQDLEKKLDTATRMNEGVCWELGGCRPELNAILGWSKMLRFKDLGQNTIEDGLKTIELNGKTLNTFLQSLCELGILVSGRVRLNLAPISLVSIIEAAVTEINSESKRHKPDVRLEVVNDLSVSHILADTRWLQKAFFQLLITCMDLSQNTLEKSVKVFVDSFNSNARVLIKEIQTPNYYAHDPEGIFAVFPYAKEALSGSACYMPPGGELAITRLIVELHGGKVSAERQQSDGQTIFTILLPLVG